jgi:hypothetical protein
MSQSCKIAAITVIFFFITACPVKYKKLYLRLLQVLYYYFTGTVEDIEFTEMPRQFSNVRGNRIPLGIIFS